MIDRKGNRVQIPPTQATTIVNPSNTIAITMAAIVILAISLSGGIVAIVLFGAADAQKENITLLVAALSPIVMALIGFLLTKKVDAVHVQINERMTQLLEEKGKAAAAEGKLEERDAAALVHGGGLVDETARVADETARIADAAEGQGVRR